jgi:uncharacterized protein
MLENTFCHIAGVGTTTERRLWSEGVRSWQDVDGYQLPFSRQKAREFCRCLSESAEQLARSNPRYFYETLPADQHWRMFPHFRNTIAYLDIETTGLSGYSDVVTTIVVYDGRSIRHYVRGQNLADFARDISDYQFVVTYNGKTFDLPFLRHHLGLPMDQAHIDLRYVLSSLGYRGGLKGCERQLGLEREGVEDIDGFFAVLLWRDYMENRNPQALETLLAYNTVDVVNLETLLHLAFNLKLKETPFSEIHKLVVPPPAKIPFIPDSKTVEKIRRRYGQWS